MANDPYSRGNRNDPFGRGGSSDSTPATDPLTELARLIGQSDPFGDAGRRDPRQPDPRGYAQPRHDDRYTDPAAGHPDPQQYDPQHYDDRSYQADGSAATDQHHADQHYDERGYRDQPGDHQQGYDDPHDLAHAPGAEMFAADPRDRDMHPGAYEGEQPDDLARFYDDEEPTPRRGWLAATVVTIVVAGVVGVAGAFAYRSVFPAGPPALITRDPGPNKIVPSQAAESAANKNADRLATAGSDERFVSHEEQPMQLPPAPAPGQSGGIAPMPSIGPAPPTMPADTASLAPTGPNAPRPVKPVRIPPPNYGASATDAPVAPAPPRPVPQPPAPSRAQVQAVPPPAPHNSGGPLSLSPQNVASAQPVPAPPPQPVAPMRTTALAPAAPVTGGGEAAAAPGYYVQLSAQGTPEDAQSSFHAFQSKYPDLLSSRQVFVRKKTVSGKIFYGAQIGPMSRQEAVQLCDGLKAAGGPCMLQHN
jgi:hypothetical protein